VLYLNWLHWGVPQIAESVSCLLDVLADLVEDELGEKARHELKRTRLTRSISSDLH
jgi:hypothetical protein